MRITDFIVEGLAIGALLDLSRNWGNFSKLQGRVREVTPSGKLKIQITTAETVPGKKGAVRVGDIVTIAPNYINKNAVLGENAADERTAREIAKELQQQMQDFYDIQRSGSKIAAAHPSNVQSIQASIRSLNQELNSLGYKFAPTAPGLVAKMGTKFVEENSMIKESSGYSLSGSYTPDLVFSKLWLARELENVLQDQNIDSVPVAYILGSWYSNLSTILRKSNVPIQHIVDVERNKQWLKTGQRIQQQMNIDNVEYMSADANRIDYRQLQDPGIVINTSTNDISDHGWFDNIPAGTIVVLQGRDHVKADAEHNFASPDELLEMFPLETVLYQGTMDLEDPETKYTRGMVIGIKGREQLRELSFLGSQCTKDCSGHRAGYAWSKARGNIDAASWSPSFNKGAALAKAGK